MKAGIYGATGYTGSTLAKILSGHPGCEILFATSQTEAGNTLDRIDPQAPPLKLVKAEDAPLTSADVVFLCLPHTASALVAKKSQEADVQVVDLSADLRFDDADEYQKWYHTPHPVPELLPAPYGLTELNRSEITGANLVANPGCYATSVLLPLLPLAAEGLITPEKDIIVDAKSGASGAGRGLSSITQFGAVHDNFSAYNIGRSHRHIGEIEQELKKKFPQKGHLIFSPHLLPVHRGILSTIYLPSPHPNRIQACLEDSYRDEPFIKVLPPGTLSALSHVVMTPDAAISVTPVNDEMAILICTIDNLMKGASSQAVQNFNLMCGFNEVTGLK